MFHKIVMINSLVWLSLAFMLVNMTQPLAIVDATAATLALGSPTPVIGVVGSGPGSNSVRYSMASVVDHGAYPVLLDVRKPEELKRHLQHVNGVIVAGNSLDINPEDYKASQEDERTKNEDMHENISDWERARDDYEYALIEQVAEQYIPFLGICSGAQRLNVAMGGTLNEHVDDQLHWGEGPHNPVLDIKIVEGSRVAGIVVDRRFKDNSIHHQHVEQVANGFRPAAYDAKENIVEAIEPDPEGPYADHPFLIGVQWHPEYGASEASKRLIQSAVDAAGRHAESNPVDLETAQSIDASPDWLRKMVAKGRDGMRTKYGYKLPEGVSLH